MTKVAVMQPYLFPYLGYFQLIDAVDEYVILDDVAWIKKGFINRNTLKDDYTFTVPVLKASQNRLIKDITIGEGWSSKLFQTITHKYSNAPYFDKYKNFIEFMIKSCEASNFNKSATFVLEEVCSILGVSTRIHHSSDFEVGHLKAASKIKQICKDFNANLYINPIGGRNLDMYQPEVFAPIKLRFIEGNFTLPRTSIIDLLFIHGEDAIKKEIGKYKLIEK